MKNHSAVLLLCTSSLFGISSNLVFAGELTIEQNSRDSEISTEIVDDSGFSVSLQQLGEDNTLKLVVDSDLTGSVSQRGIGGRISIDSSPGDQYIELIQLGVSNAVDINIGGVSTIVNVDQSGQHNVINHDVTGTGNYASLLQSGSGNTLSLVQSGSRNRATLEQEGTNNTLDVEQHENGLAVNVRQSGNNDIIIIR